MPSFNPAAQRLFLRAFSEASRLGHPSVTPEHLLTALAQAPETKHVLASIGLPFERVRAVVEKQMPRSANELPHYDARLRELVARASTLATPVESKHLLLAMAGEGKGLAYDLLNHTGELSRLELLLDA